MAKYAVITSTKRPKALAFFNSISSARKWREKKYRSGYKGRLAILGKKGLILARRRR